jgi:hypothetical protein
MKVIERETSGAAATNASAAIFFRVITRMAAALGLDSLS